MSEVTVQQMRDLRKRARELNITLVGDLRPFLHATNNLTFRRLPDSKSDPNVTTTCSCLMSLTLCDRLEEFYTPKAGARPQAVFKKLVQWRWASSGLPPMNPFTVTVVLRAMGFLMESTVLPSQYAEETTHRDRKKGTDTLAAIARQLGAGIPPSFAVHGPAVDQIRKFPASAAIVYWYVDAIHRSGVRLPKPTWRKICRYAYEEFSKQKSYVEAGHEALMDPVAMAMAACLSARLRRICMTDSRRTGTSPGLLESLHSAVELVHGIPLLFEHQTDSGIWPKYFPLFSYAKPRDKAGGGSNYCFTFELLEAILNEFGDSHGDLLQHTCAFQGLAKGVTWCEQHRLEYCDRSGTYCGWNSGGQIESLVAGKPESWATAVVHMFLHELDKTLSYTIQRRLLRQYDATVYERMDKPWKDFLDVRLLLPSEKKMLSMKTLLQDEVLTPLQAVKAPEHLLSQQIPSRVSVLLFGPPGTSKTAITHALAQKLGWPLVQLDPSHFLAEGLPNIYDRADKIFRDLMDLFGVVILFDEMDALVQARAGDNTGSQDITTRFLTTSMLPKLAQLHDHGRTVFIMATNFQKRFDDAIKRPGRFDLLLCMRPPSWRVKRNRLDVMLRGVRNIGDVKDAQRLLAKFCRDASKEQMDVLDNATYSEIRAFLDRLRGRQRLADVLKKMGGSNFLAKVAALGEYITLRKGGSGLNQLEAEDIPETKIQ